MITETITIQFGKEYLICQVSIPSHRPATYLQPEEGGVEDFEIVCIDYNGLCITDLVMELAPDLIFEKIKDELINQ